MPPAAATCRRLSCRASTDVAQHSTTPSAAFDNACSVAHKTSRGCADDTIASCARSTPAETHAGPCARCGGATSMPLLPSCCICSSAGSNNEHSPNPVPSSRISVSAPRGHPPPGNSASSAAKPLGTEGIFAWAKPLAEPPAERLPRQTSGRANTSSRETSSFMTKKYKVQCATRRTRPTMTP